MFVVVVVPTPSEEWDMTKDQGTPSMFVAQQVSS